MEKGNRSNLMVEAEIIPRFSQVKTIRAKPANSMPYCKNQGIQTTKAGSIVEMEYSNALKKNIAGDVIAIIHIKKLTMKKLIFLVMFVVFDIACNNADDPTDTDDAYQPNSTTRDSIPATRNGDTSSYERMPNMITDSMPK